MSLPLASPTPVAAGRRRARSRIVAIATAAVALGALALTLGQPAGAAVRTDPLTGVRNNLIANASFESATAPWSGTALSRRAKTNAPDGQYAARVIARDGRLSLDDWPGSVSSSAAGTTYTAALSVALANAASTGAPITLVLREHDRDGSWVASNSVTGTLHASYTRLSVDLTAKHDGDYLDMYAYQDNVAPTSSFFADAASLTAVAPVVTPPPGTSTASTLGLLAIDSGQADHLGDTSKYAYVVLQESQASHIAAIKAANPNTQVLTYMEAAATQSQTCSSATPPMHLPHDSYGVNYCWAKKYHPGWFLTDSAGKDLAAIDYPRSMTMDVGNPDYAAAWAQGTAAAAKADGFDGVYLDDVNIDPGHGLEGRIKQYTDEQYGAATVRFASSVADYLTADGLRSIANLGASPWVSWMEADTLALASHFTAVNREHYSRYGDICGSFGQRFNDTATTGTPPMNIMLSSQQALEAAGTSITGVDYGYSVSNAADLATMAYGRAQFLLAWNGQPGSAYFFRSCGTVDTANQAWMADMGTPLSPVVTVAGVYFRAYTKGVVVLNPSRTQSLTVPLPLNLLSLVGGVAKSTVSVAAQSATLLPAGS